MALISQALYSAKSQVRPYIRAGPTDTYDYDGIWDRAARRIEEIDPNGREAYMMVKCLMLDKARRDNSRQS